VSLPYLTKLLKTLAPQLGASVVVEPEWGIVSQIKYKNGVVRSVRMYSLDLNPFASSDIARDKDYAKFFMKKAGYPVAPGKTFFKDSWANAIGSNQKIPQALMYAKKMGYPIIVKPNSQSQGSGVNLVWNETELRAALRGIFEIDKVALIEEYMPGHDYRVVVLDGEIISAYERISLSVTGDGIHSIEELLAAKQKLFIKSKRDTTIDVHDARIKTKLKHAGLKLDSTLPKGEKVYLLDNANLSTGGDSVDVTKTIHEKFKKIAIKLTRDMGLRIAGVDIMVTKGDITEAPQRNGYYIIEINAAPGLDHYVTAGKEQRKIVEDMYLKVLKALGKKD
jgi:D-alanine-D-alanine ligase-like ATP-grasp enzyme